jgi:phospholipid/cholesterol/gamma-HCH transport system substrate-binding protein
VQGRPAIVEDIKQLNALTKNLSTKKNLSTLESSIKIFPIKIAKLGNAASSGSEFNFFLCEIQGSITLPEVKVGDAVILPETHLDLTGDSGLAVGGERCNQPGYSQ